MSGRKRKASEDDDRMSASPTSSPSFSARPLPSASTPRSIKRTRTSVTSGRPLELPRLLETLSPNELRGLLQTICDQNPSIAHEVVTRAPRPSIDSTLSVLNKYQTSFKNAFPFGNRPTSDYTYNRVRQPMLQLLEALKDYTPHFLPPNESQCTLSLTYLDAVTNIVHQLPNWDTYQHNQHKHEAYEELSPAWSVVIQEAVKKNGGIQIQVGGWEEKILKHNELSGGMLQGAVNEMKKSSVSWLGTGQGSSNMASGGDERAAIRQQILSGTYGADLSVGHGRW